MIMGVKVNNNEIFQSWYSKVEGTANYNKTKLVQVDGETIMLYFAKPHILSIATYVIPITILIILLFGLSWASLTPLISLTPYILGTQRFWYYVSKWGAWKHGYKDKYELMDKTSAENILWELGFGTE